MKHTNQLRRFDRRVGRLLPERSGESLYAQGGCVRESRGHWVRHRYIFRRIDELLEQDRARRRVVGAGGLDAVQRAFPEGEPGLVGGAVQHIGIEQGRIGVGVGISPAIAQSEFRRGDELLGERHHRRVDRGAGDLRHCLQPVGVGGRPELQPSRVGNPAVDGVVDQDDGHHVGGRIGVVDDLMQRLDVSIGTARNLADVGCIFARQRRALLDGLDIEIDDLLRRADLQSRADVQGAGEGGGIAGSVGDGCLAGEIDGGHLDIGRMIAAADRIIERERVGRGM